MIALRYCGSTTPMAERIAAVRGSLQLTASTEASYDMSRKNIYWCRGIRRFSKLYARPAQVLNGIHRFDLRLPGLRALFS